MSQHVARFVVILLATMFLALPPLHAQGSRTVVTTEDADYFGFDLRTERDVSLEECEAACIADGQCRAFTYNVRAEWCFLKSDHGPLNPFAGAVAGRIVEAGQADIGAPPALAFLSAGLLDEARQYRGEITTLAGDPSMGVVLLAQAARGALDAGDARGAIASYQSALSLSSEDSSLWSSLAAALLAATPADWNERTSLPRDASSSAINAYQTSRTESDRAEALAWLARALDSRDLYRPAMAAYEASLALVDDENISFEQAELRSRRGFRVMDHTVDTEAAAPRICVQLSEDLPRSGVDFSSFVTLDGAPAPAVDASGQQVCVEGLRHGRSYRVTLRRGLPSTVGEVLENDVALSIYVRDRSPSLRFTGDSFVLPSGMRRGIPLVSVNTDSADISLYRVGDRALAQLMSGSQFLRQLGGWEADNLANDLGEPVWEGRLEVASELNREIVTSFPVDEALPERKPGVYVLVAVPEGDTSEPWTTRATQWFVVSDIGLSSFSGEDGLSVFARSLGSAKPIDGVELQLLARNNEVLGTATTDSGGKARFDPGLMRGTAAMAPVALLALGTDDDFVFLDLTRAGFDLSDRGVEGRAAPGALDIFAWTERGIYRAGETVHAAALARDDAGEAVENLPLTFILSRPDGVEDRRVTSDGRALGGHALALALSDTAMRGTWSLAIHADANRPALANASFLVEDFVPDRIEFDLGADKEQIEADGAASVSVDGRFLYGAPAEGMRLEGEVAVSTDRAWSAFPGYRFGLADEEDLGATILPLENLPETDAQGRATFNVALGELPSTTRLLEATVAVRMREPGGRAVERRLSLPVVPDSTLIGIRPDFAGDSLPENSTASFAIIAAGPDGQREELDGLRWSLKKIDRNYTWYRTESGWNYEPVTTTSEVANGTVDAGLQDAGRVSFPVQWGRYRLEVETADPLGPASSVEFEAGWFVEAASTETPDALEIALDKESYRVGETARLKISPRFAGEVLVTIGNERLSETITASIPEDGGEVDIPIGEDWGTGAYVTATLYRPGEAAETRMPARAIGVKWLAVDPGDRSLQVSLDVPEMAAPRERLTVPISLANLPAGERAYVTVAAVDVGILNLTNHTAPDPQGWYFGQRGLGLEIRDLYGRLIDGSLGAAGRLRTGGDGGILMQGSPPTERLLAFFSGPVELDDEGHAEVSFDLPEFNGTARIMAVAWTKDGVGQAQADIIVRDPIVVTASAPRFLAPGDRALMRLDIANTDGVEGDYVLSIRTQGTAGVEIADAPGSLWLAQGGSETLTLPISATRTGETVVTVTLQNEDGTAIERSAFLTVRPAAMPVTSQQIVSLPADGGTIRVDGGLLGDSLMDGAFVSLGVSPLSAFDIPSVLMALDRYPYGCAEQITSRALPLLYAAELSQLAGMPVDPGLDERIAKAISGVLDFQTSTGSFGLWGPGWGNLWLDAYVGEFLTRASELGHPVPSQALARVIQNLQNTLSYTTDVEERGTDIAYALYVLARNRRASVGDLRYYADTRLDEFDSPMARAQVGAALALYGDSERADRAFNSALRKARGDAHSDNLLRSDFGSPLRDGAAILALAAETSPAPTAIPAMMEMVETARARRTHTSTQEQAWMLLAARAMGTADADIQLEVDGAEHRGSFARRLEGRDLIEQPITLVNRSDEAVDLVLTTVAAPAQPLAAGGDGFDIGRSYFTLDGEAVNVSEVVQNERYVVVLRFTEYNSWPSQVVMTDLLPAGFEIDNPRLVGSADLANFEWLGDANAAHVEFRYDRFTAAFERTENSPREHLAAYVVRAVTPGVYAHPAAIVEDMYRPQLSARTATGAMEVLAPR
ncbi:MAG: alpha-2-macroglobulin family protein [Rhizobiaceae bacterium]